MNPLHTACEWGSVSGVRAYLYISTNQHQKYNNQITSLFRFGTTTDTTPTSPTSTIITTTSQLTIHNNNNIKTNITGIEIQDNTSGCNALHIACKNNYYDIIMILLDTLTKFHTNQSKCDIINTKDYHNGWTPLHYITSYSSNTNNKKSNQNDRQSKSNNNKFNNDDTLSIVMKLIEHGAIVNINAMFGTPLHCAIRKGHDRIVQYLIEYAGAQIVVKNNNTDDDNNNDSLESVSRYNIINHTNHCYDISPLDVACQRGDKNMVRYLIDHGAVKYESIEYKGDCIHYVASQLNSTSSTSKYKNNSNNNQFKLLRMLIKEGGNILHIKNSKSIFHYDWMNGLLYNKDDKFHNILQNIDLYRNWNLLALICYQLYGDICNNYYQNNTNQNINEENDHPNNHYIELFQLIDDKKKQVKMPPPGSKYLSPKYLAPPPPVPVPPPATEPNDTTTGTTTTAGAGAAAGAAIDTTIISASAIQQQQSNNNGTRVLMSQSDIQLLRSALDEYVERTNTTAATTTTTTTVATTLNQNTNVEPQQEIIMPGNGQILGSNDGSVWIDNSNQTSLLLSDHMIQQEQQSEDVPDFKEASYNDYNWMVHALASISVCPLNVMQFITLQCFPSQLRVQRLHGCTPLSLACQRTCSHNNTTKKNNQRIITTKFKAPSTATTTKTDTDKEDSPLSPLLLSRRFWSLKHDDNDCNNMISSTNNSNNHIKNNDNNNDFDDTYSNEVIIFLVQTYPAACKIADDWNTLPLQYALYTKKTRCIQSLIDAYPDALSIALSSSSSTRTPMTPETTMTTAMETMTISNKSIQTIDRNGNSIENTNSNSMMNRHYNSAITRHITICKEYIFAIAETASVDTIFQLIRYHPATLTET